MIKISLLPSTIFVDLQEKHFNPANEVAFICVIRTGEYASTLHTLQVETVNLTANTGNVKMM